MSTRRRFSGASGPRWASITPCGSPTSPSRSTDRYSSPGQASTASSEWYPAKANDNVAQQAFRRDCLRELVKIKAPWPGLNYATGKGVLILSPSTPAIPPAHQLQLVE